MNCTFRNVVNVKAQGESLYHSVGILLEKKFCTYNTSSPVIMFQICFTRNSV